MLKSYIKIAWRNFAQNKFYSSINVLGLSIGLACLILIMLFVTDELSYDRFHPNSDRLHLVAAESQFGNRTSRGVSTSFPVGKTMKQEIPEVEQYTTITWPNSASISVDGEEFNEEDNVFHATSDFFKVFPFPLVQGDPENVLDQPGAVVITEKMAAKYFPEGNALGKTIHIAKYDQHEFVVTGIAKNILQNSYVNFDVIASIEKIDVLEKNREKWSARMYQTFVTLQEGARWEEIEPKVSEMVSTHVGEKAKMSFFSVPVTDVYLSDLVSSAGFKGDMKYIYIFSAIALFILLLACINYMNLATARAAGRAREVGIRKVAGAGRPQLIKQFIGEAVLAAMVAFLVGLFIAELALPYFNAFIGKELTLNFYDDAAFIGILFGIAGIIGLFSGSYPAFYLSRFRPAGVLKTSGEARLSGAGLRKTLVVGQFAISSALIICTLVVFNQLDYVLNKDLGFQDEQVMYIPINASEGSSSPETFKQTVKTHTAVEEVSNATAVPGRFRMQLSQPYDPQNPEHSFGAYMVMADDHYDDVLGLELAAGRFLSEKRAIDSDARVINEAMVKELGWESPEAAVGRELHNGAKIVGVVKDFHFQSLHSKISPVLISLKPEGGGMRTSIGFSSSDFLVLRFNPGQTGDLINYLKEEWRKQISEEPMSYYFLDEQFAQQYETEQKLSQAFTIFALVAVVIAGLGLFGLAAFSAQKRTKEIGIRKVMGATAVNIVGLLSKDFVKLVLIGFVIAVPIAWYAMNRWLADFAYRIEIGAGVFLLAGTAAVLIALATVSWQSLRAAMANPVESLRTE